MQEVSTSPQHAGMAATRRTAMPRGSPCRAPRRLCPPCLWHFSFLAEGHTRSGWMLLCPLPRRCYEPGGASGHPAGTRLPSKGKRSPSRLQGHDATGLNH